MTQVVIENPVINSPFAEPARYFHHGLPRAVTPN